MRLWHESLILYLPRQQLLGQHRECCTLRGKGWGKKHATVDYVFKYDPSFLVAYHNLVMDEMRKRGHRVNCVWYDDNYRGKILGGVNENWVNSGLVTKLYNDSCVDGLHIYPEHDDKYLEECLENLKNKGIEIKIEKE